MATCFHDDPPTPLVGSLRDAVATSSGLLLLLRSRNVAPKAIAQLLPSLQHSFGNTNAEFSELCARLGPPTPPSLVHLGELLANQVERFNAAIQQGSRSAVNARARLGLEQAIDVVTHQLSALLGLFELWSDTLRPRADLDLVELLTLSRFGDQPPIPNRQTLHVSLAVEVPELALRAPPRAILNLLGLTAAVIAAQDRGAALSLRLHQNANTRELEMGHAALTTRYALALQLPSLLPETTENLLDATRHLGIEAQHGAGVFRFSWV